MLSIMVNKTHVKPHFGNRNMLTGQGAPGIFIVPEQARQKAAKLKATNTATKKGCDDALRGSSSSSSSCFL